jgi:hypothetical protein
MLPTMPPAAELCKLSYKEFNNLDNMEKAIFSSFLVTVYDNADSKRLAWAEDSGQILKAFNGEMAKNEKYIIYANGDFAGFYIMMPCENKKLTPTIFIATLFEKQVTSLVEKYLAARTF